MMDTNTDIDITNLYCEPMSVESTEITITDTSEHVSILIVISSYEFALLYLCKGHFLEFLLFFSI